MKRRHLFAIHGWLGVTAGLLLFLVCWTGTVATVSHEIDSLLDPAIRVEDGPARADFVRIHGALRERWPSARDLWISAPRRAGRAAEAFFTTEGEHWHRVWVHPERGDILAERSYFNVQRFFRSLHMHLFDLSGLGIWLIGLSALVLLTSTLTALFFYRRWWTRWFDLRRQGGTRVFWSGIHRTGGLWSLWFLLLIGVTGTWYLVEHVRAAHGDGILAFADTGDYAVRVIPPPGADAAPLPVGALLDRVRALRPELELRSVWWTTDGVFYADGRGGNPLLRDRAEKLYLDAATGRVLHDQRAAELSAYWLWSDMADPLHFGTFGGLGTQLLWVLFGLLLCGLCLTGAWLHACRLARDRDGRLGWRGTLPAQGLTIALVGWIAWAGWQEFLDYGTVVDGVRRAPDVPTAVLAFLAAWGALTVLVLAWWILRLASARATLPTRPATGPRTAARKPPPRRPWSQPRRCAAFSSGRTGAAGE